VGKSTSALYKSFFRATTQSSHVASTNPLATKPSSRWQPPRVTSHQACSLAPSATRCYLKKMN
jgi:hypothetical protein